MLTLQFSWEAGESGERMFIVCQLNYCMLRVRSVYLST